MLNLARANLSNEPLNVAINARVEEASARKHAYDQARGYLGASLIGDDCLRKIQFEWMIAATTFPARVRSIFARGHFFEAESRQLLVDAGFAFAPPEVLGFVAADGLIAGHADGIIINAPAFPVSISRLRPCGSTRDSTPRTIARSSATDWRRCFPATPRRWRSIRIFSACTNPALVMITNADTCKRFFSPCRSTLAARRRRVTAPYR